MLNRSILFFMTVDGYYDNQSESGYY